MNGLAGERAEAGGDEEKPGEKLRPVGRRAEEPAGLLGEIDEDRGRVEHPRGLAPGPLLVDDRRNLAVRVDGAKGRRVLFALARVDGDGL